MLSANWSTGTMRHSDNLTPALRALAARQWRDYQQKTPGTFFGEGRGALSVEDAYAVQTEVARLRCEVGDAVAGYKIGCIGPAVVEQFGMRGPIYARVFRNELVASTATLRHSAYVNLAVEGEMAVRIGADGTIETAFPVIELHHFLFRGAPRTLAELVANNGINAGAVVPDPDVSMPLEGWETARTLKVSIDGAVVDAGDLWAMQGGAAEAVHWLREGLGRHGVSLAPGDLVLTGTPLGLHPVRPGQRVSVSVDNRELVTCQIE